MARRFSRDCDDADDCLEPEPEQAPIMRSVDRDDPPGRFPTAEDSNRLHVINVVAGNRHRAKPGKGRH